MASTVALPSQGSLPGAASARPKLCHARCQLASGMATTASAAAVAWEAEAMAVPAKRARVWRTASSVAGMWKEVQGCGDWEGLLQPLHPVVRDEVARYGELVDACYKAFDLDPSSRRYLNCKYGKQGMLAEVGMAGAGYEVTKYIYASPDVEVPTMEASTSGRWIGYVAVSDDDQTRRLGRRDILVSFRGTVTPAEWFANLRSSLVPARLDPCDPRPDVKVESGFLSLYTSSDGTCRFGGGGSCREQLLREVSRLVEEQSKSRPGDDISITLAGHSMGSALALLCGYDLAELGINRDASGRRVPVTVFSFGGPRVGNVQFKARCDELGVKALRVANVRDPVTKLPGLFLNEGSAALLGQLSGSCYTHVGVELPLDFFNMGNLAGAHDLPSYITLLKRDKNIKARPATKEDDREGVLARVKQLVGRRRAAALPWPGAALQVGDFVHQWLGSAAN